MKFDERSPKKKKKIPLFYFLDNCGKVCPTVSEFFFLAYLVPLDVFVTGNITAKLCEVWSEIDIFCILVTMATAAIWICSTPQKLPHTTVYISTKVHEA